MQWWLCWPGCVGKKINACDYLPCQCCHRQPALKRIMAAQTVINSYILCLTPLNMRETCQLFWIFDFRMFNYGEAFLIIFFQLCCCTVHNGVKKHSLRLINYFVDRCRYRLFHFSWISDINDHEKQVFSQNGEDGVLEFIFDQIGLYVETTL